MKNFKGGKVFSKEEKLFVKHVIKEERYKRLYKFWFNVSLILIGISILGIILSIGMLTANKNSEIGSIMLASCLLMLFSVIIPRAISIYYEEKIDNLK